MTTIYLITIILFLIVCFILCTVIMMQESKSGGLGAAFGASDPTQSVFGTATADVLKTFTGWLAFVFLSLCVVLSFWTSSLGRAQSGPTPIDIEQMES